MSFYKRGCVAVILYVCLFVTAGCEVDKVTDYTNQTLESFWEVRSLDDPRLKPYQVDDVLVSLAWPHAGFLHYDASLSLVAASPNAEVEVLSLQISNLGVVPVEAVGVIKVNQKSDGQALYQAERVIALKIDAERMKRAAAISDGQLKARVAVRVRRGDVVSEKEVNFAFEERVRKYLPLR